MYAILVTGIPAAGKSTMAGFLAEKLKLPVISKDSIKELLFDSVGFRSREEKVKLGVASMHLMYDTAGRLMQAGQPFILENNFEYSSEQGLRDLLTKYPYSILTITLTGDYKVIYQRFLTRNASPDRHPGHVVNDCYPLKTQSDSKEKKEPSVSFEDFVHGIEKRGFDKFTVGGDQIQGDHIQHIQHIQIDTTDFSNVDMETLYLQIAAWREKVLRQSAVKI